MQVLQPMTSSEHTHAAGLSPGTETILLVDDEEPVQWVVRDILERRGYTVFVACDGHTALKLSSEFTGTIHLLLTDIAMPGMSGLEVAKCLASERPSLKIIYMSGHPETAVPESGPLSRGRCFLRKPFLAATLAHKIREVLDQATD